MLVLTVSLTFLMMIGITWWLMFGLAGFDNAARDVGLQSARPDCLNARASNAKDDERHACMSPRLVPAAGPLLSASLP